MKFALLHLSKNRVVSLKQYDEKVNRTESVFNLSTHMLSIDDVKLVTHLPIVI